jgi:hypothetical protein
MTGDNKRKYPIGIQTFSEIIREGYLYVDKTDLVWQLTNYAKFIFLSRPRRFGKSLLASTLESYFKGERELFEGLKIMALEKEWQQYPVMRLDISTSKAQSSPDALRARLMLILDYYAEIYGRKAGETTPGAMLEGLIRRANAQTGKQAVVIIDEYDAPLLDVLHEDNTLDEMRKVMQEFYVPLKANEQYVKFCFITGITKFSQLSIFSTINNLTNVTMDTMFASICGITESELTTVLKEDIERLAALNSISYDEMHQKLKLQYDGYHFTEDSEEIYNPFSLLKAFQQRKVGNYWFENGTPTFLIRQMQHYGTDITSLDSLELPSDSFDVPTEAMTTALPMLYQSGYLTIKGYDREAQTYFLSIPNQEVRIGYTKGLLPTYIGLEIGDVQAGFALKFWRALKKDDVHLAMQEMQAYLAGISLTPSPSPKGEGSSYIQTDNQARSLSTPLALWRGAGGEALYLIFSMLNVYVRTQVRCADGRTDMVVWMPDTVYVFKFKVNDTAENALKQIDSKGYAILYQRKVVKVGVKMNADTRTLEEWVIS